MPRLSRPAPRLTALPGRLAATGASGATAGWQRADGASSAARGYGADWRRLRERVLAEEPLCRACAAAGRTSAADQVDHIRPFRGLLDPLRLDRGNLQPLCAACHTRKTARQGAEGVGA